MAITPHSGKHRPSCWQLAGNTDINDRNSLHKHFRPLSIPYSKPPLAPMSGLWTSVSWQNPDMEGTTLAWRTEGQYLSLSSTPHPSPTALRYQHKPLSQTGLAVFTGL